MLDRDEVSRLIREDREAHSSGCLGLFATMLSTPPILILTFGFYASIACDAGWLTHKRFCDFQFTQFWRSPAKP